MRTLVLDAGALLGLERRDRRTVVLLERAAATRTRVAIPAGVLAQVWRDGARQAVVARVLGGDLVSVLSLDQQAAKAVGVLRGWSGHPDVVDVQVALLARQLDARVVTSDPADLRRVDPRLTLIVV